MKNFARLAGINIGVVVIYSLLIRLLITDRNSSNAGLDVELASATAVGIHVAICAVVTIVSFCINSASGQNWLATTGLVLLVGFSVCLGVPPF